MDGDLYAGRGSGLLQRKRRRDRAAANRSRGEGLRRRAVLRSSRACRHGRTGQAVELGLYPAPGYESEEHFWLDTDGERCVFAGAAGSAARTRACSTSAATTPAPTPTRTSASAPLLVRYSGDSGDLDHLDDDPTSMSGTPDKKARRSPSAESLLGLPTYSLRHWQT